MEIQVAFAKWPWACVPGEKWRLTPKKKGLHHKQGHIDLHFTHVAIVNQSGYSCFSYLVIFRDTLGPMLLQNTEQIHRTPLLFIYVFRSVFATVSSGRKTLVLIILFHFLLHMSVLAI